MHASSDDWITAQYSSFSISDDTDKYRLSVSGYSGTAKNALLFATPASLLANGMKFSTKDEDNDNNADGNCAADPARLNGWWYNDCSLSCLNYDTLAQWYRLERAKDVTQSRMWVKAPGNVTITLCLFVCLCVR